MALTFPLEAADFFNTLKIQEVVFDLGESLEQSETGGGEVLTADIGVRLYQCDLMFAPLRYSEMAQMKAKIQTLRYAGRSLLAHPFPIIAPQADPDGVLLGASTVVLNAVNANNRELKLSGLPAGYVFTPGDMLSFTYGSSPQRHAMHEIVTGGTTLGTGITPYLEVGSFIRTGWTLGTVVRLIRPLMKMVYIPGSFDPGKISGQMHQGVKCSFLQTLR